MKKFAVLVSGGGTNLQALIDRIADGTISDAQISVVISNNQKAYALTRAEKAGIPNFCVARKAYETREEFEQALLERIKAFQADFVVLAGFLVIVPSCMIEAYRGRILNIHPSLIPSFCGTGYYGLKVHEAVLERGVKVTGATVHFVDEGTDTGPIVLQKAVEVLEGDTPELLQKRVMEQAEQIILPEAVRLYAEGKIRIKGRRTYTGEVEDIES